MASTIAGTPRREAGRYEAWEHPQTSPELLQYLFHGLGHVRVFDSADDRGVRSLPVNPGLAADRLAPSDGGLDLGQLFRVGAEQQRGVDVTAEAHGVRSVEQIKVACRSISWPDVSGRKMAAERPGTAAAG